jgi:hypothetical protein
MPGPVLHNQSYFHSGILASWDRPSHWPNVIQECWVSSSTLHSSANFLYGAPYLYLYSF